MRTYIHPIVVFGFLAFYSTAHASETLYANINNKADIVALGEGIGLDSTKVAPCYSTTVGHAADSMIRYTIRVDDHSISKRSTEAHATSASIGGSYSFGVGDVSGGVDSLNKTTSEAQVDDQTITVEVDLTADVGKDYISSISLNDLGKTFAEQGSRSFNDHCGVLTAFGLFRGIQVNLLFTLTANSSGEKNTLLNALKASLGGSYYGASAKASLSQQLDQAFEEHRKDISISLNGYVRAADGIKAVPDMANALKNAADHPFDAAITSAASVIQNLKGDAGTVTSVEFENSNIAVPAFHLLDWQKRFAFWKKSKNVLQALHTISDMTKGSTLTLPASALQDSPDDKITLARIGWQRVCAFEARKKYITTDISNLNLAFDKTCGYPTETRVDQALNRVDEAVARCLSADATREGYCSDEALIFAIVAVIGSNEVNIFTAKPGVTIESSTAGQTIIIHKEDPSAMRGAGTIFDTPESESWLSDFYQNIEIYRNQATQPAGWMLDRFSKDVDSLWAEFAPPTIFSYVDIHGNKVPSLAVAALSDSPVFLTSGTPHIYIGYSIVSNANLNLNMVATSPYLDGFDGKFLNTIMWPKSFTSSAGQSAPVQECGILVECIRDNIFTSDRKDATSVEVFIKFETLNGIEKRSLGSLAR